ncbi:hypothetical protein [Cryobacterium sp. Y62]|uniref:hypothetical protein n=1 Tax=Cryobacterium sp. Y62 TaxID=2048284 RepID=UPI000CE478D5|nr:hypothetical protein [Cryobacterium sp. Y62]
MATIPQSTKDSVQQRLACRQRERWPELTRVTVRCRGGFAYVTGHRPNGDELPLCRLRYAGSASRWGFAIYRVSHDDYEDSYLPVSTPEDGLDIACNLYLASTTDWT